MDRPDPPNDPKIARMLARLARDAAGARYCAYAIRDPLTGDRRDWTTGDPFFVGQTRDLARRGRAHLAVGAEDADQLPHRARIAAILAAGRAPVFELLEAAPTRLAALEAEARWVRRFRSEGFEVAWAGADGDELGPTRAWSLTLAEAEEAGLGVAIACEACGMELGLPLDGLAARSAPGAKLASLREAVSCPNCGRGDVLCLVPPAGGA